jgi:hypothetical protein
MRDQLLKTKTLKIESPNYHKVQIKLKIIQTEYTFFGKDGKETGTILMRGFGDNEKFTRNCLSEYNLSKGSLDEILEVLKSVYIMDLTHLSV